MDPKAKSNLLLEEVLDETLVYDLERHRAHCLNATAGFLLRSADGTRGVAELSALAGEEFGATTSEDVVRIGLERLRAAGLVQWPEVPGQAERVSRRELLKKVATVGLLLPTVMTLVSPLPAQAATLIDPALCSAAYAGSCCTTNQTCRQRKGGYSCVKPNC